MHDELGGVNPADLVRRCAGTRCDKSFQGSMPAGWERLGPDAMRKLGDGVTISTPYGSLPKARGRPRCWPVERPVQDLSQTACRRDQLIADLDLLCKLAPQELIDQARDFRFVAEETD